jgi:deazaflavin-dependent oxidoreductase (nitroreductase family)
MPLWFGHVNKAIFNKREIRMGVRPVLTHVGRTSGTTYHTPLEAFAVDDGYVFILMYGSRSDWVRNVLASQRAQLQIDGEVVELGSPRLIDEKSAWALMPQRIQRPPKFLRVSEFLHMNGRPIATEPAGADARPAT